MPLKVTFVDGILSGLLLLKEQCDVNGRKNKNTFSFKKHSKNLLILTVFIEAHMGLPAGGCEGAFHTRYERTNQSFTQRLFIV